MRKFILSIIVLSVLFISACSASNDSYTKELKKAKELMDDQTFSEAIEVLDNLAENVVTGDTYEHGRLLLIEELQYSAESMQQRFAELESLYENSIELYNEAIKSDPINFDLYVEAMRSLETAINSFEGIEESKMYKELVEAKEDLTENLKKYATSIKDDIDASLKETDFATADEKLNELRTLSHEFSEIISDEIVTQYKEKIEGERDRFIYVPETAFEWNEIIHESDAGKIEFSGIRQIDSEDAIEVMVTYTGDYYSINKSIDFSPSIILSNGDKETASLANNRQYKDKVVHIYQFNNYDGFTLDEIIRFDVNLPMVQEEPLQIAFNGIDEKKLIELEGVKSIKEIHRPDWELSTKDYEVIVDRVFVDKYDVEVSGVIKPLKDATIYESSDAYFPFSNDHSNIGYGGFGNANETEIYKDTEKEFEINHSFSEPISEFNHQLKLMIYGQDLFVDLLSGELIDDPESVLITEFTGSRLDEDVGFISSEQKELFNQSGERVDINSIIYDGTFGSKSTYHIGDSDSYKKLTSTVHVHEDYSGVDYGTTNLEIYIGKGDEEEEVYSKEIEEDHKSVDISVDVTDASYLKITTSPNRGDKGHQILILENPVVK